ncbi:hypothetical protein [Ruegeria hyattellae]
MDQFGESIDFELLGEMLGIAEKPIGKLLFFSVLGKAFGSP